MDIIDSFTIVLIAISIIISCMIYGKIIPEEMIIYLCLGIYLGYLLVVNT